MQNTVTPPASWLKALLPKSLSPTLLMAGVALIGIGGGTTVYLQSRATSAPVPATVATPAIRTVTALGRLEPADKVIRLKAPTSTQESRLDQLLVKKGDRVKAGQVIAILDSRDRLQATLEQAQQEIQVAQAKLTQVQAGAKQGEIAAQQAEIARLEANQQATITAQEAAVARLQAETQNAAVEVQRYASLYQDGAISASQRDSKQLALDTTQKSLQQAQAELNRLQSTRSPELDRAKATLDQITDVRPVDVSVAQADVDRAIAAAKQAAANLNQAYVRSPQDGVIMDIHTRPGEVISSEGIVEIGQTNQMVAIAEVYQSDIQAVQPGQVARIKSEALPSELTGTVDWVDLKVRRQTVVNTDPSENIDGRVVEVQVRLDPASSQKAAAFTNLQVQVEIQR